MEKREIYLDNSATTRVFPEVVRLMDTIYLDEYGNPSSMHHKGVEAERHIREAKKTFADILKCTPQNIYFTSCGTESDNISLIGAARANLRSGKHLITTAIEHPAILETMKYLESEGFEVTILPVDHNGRVDPEAVYDAVREDTTLVSVMHTNNEIGALEPIAEIGRRIKEKNPNTLFHVDAVQGFCKAIIQPKKMHIDLLSASGHKIHAPKGIGLLYIGDHVKIHNIMYGGGQQKNLRPGTEPIEIISAFEAAVKAYPKDLSHYERLNAVLRERLSNMTDVVVNSPDLSRGVPNILSFSVLGVRSEIMLHSLEEKQIYVSSGSACSKGKISAVPDSFGIDAKRADSTIRVSFCMENTEEQISILANEIEAGIKRFRR